MKKYFLILGLLCHMALCSCNDSIPCNEIHYTSSDGKIIEPYDGSISMYYAGDYYFGEGVSVVSNVYENGQGVITCNGDITTIVSAFCFSNLTSITIPDSVTTIGNYAFSFSPNLKSITIPDGVTSIGADAFNECKSLTSITIPDSVTSIGEGAFRGCTSLTSITIPDNVTSIGAAAFYGCESLTSITIPDSVTSIGESAFAYCSSLTAFYGKYASDDNRCLIAYGALNSFAPAGLTFYTIPGSVTSIGNSAFAGCTSLKNITIPNSVTYIGSRVFNGCENLRSITIPNSVTYIGDAAFVGCKDLTTFYGKYASEDNRCIIVDGTLNFFAPAGLTFYAIPYGVTSIGSEVFNGCENLKSIIIPNSVTSIGSEAFCGCTNLIRIYCEAVTPPSLEIAIYYHSYHNVFENTDDALMCVPQESVNAYQTAEGWSDYAYRIVGYNFGE